MNRVIPLCALTFGLSLAALAAFAQTAPMDDGPWIDLPEGLVVDMTPPTYDDIVVMSDMDGDPSVISPDEQRMIDVLSQVLGSRPITD